MKQPGHSVSSTQTRWGRSEGGVGFPLRLYGQGDKVLSNRGKEGGRIKSEFLPALFPNEYGCEMILVGKPVSGIAFERGSKRN